MLRNPAPLAMGRDQETRRPRAATWSYTVHKSLQTSKGESQVALDLGGVSIFQGNYFFLPQPLPIGPYRNAS